MHIFKYFTAAMAGVASLSSVLATPATDSATLKNIEGLEALLARDNLALVSRQDLGAALGGLTDLLASLRRFLSADFLDDTHSVVTGLAGLLAPPFVNQTRGLITEAGGLLDGLGPLLDNIEPLLQEIGPLLEQLGEIDLGGLVGAVSGLLTPEAIRSIGNLLNNLTRLLTREFVDQISGLIADVAPVSHASCIVYQLKLMSSLPSLSRLLLNSSLPLLLLFLAVVAVDRGQGRPPSTESGVETRVNAI